MRPKDKTASHHKTPIQINRSDQADHLPFGLRELADLLADIALAELTQTHSSQPCDTRKSHGQ